MEILNGIGTKKELTLRSSMHQKDGMHLPEYSYSDADFNLIKLLTI